MAKFKTEYKRVSTLLDDEHRYFRKQCGQWVEIDRVEYVNCLTDDSIFSKDTSSHVSGEHQYVFVTVVCESGDENET